MEIPNTLCSNVYDFAFCPEPCYDRLVDLADPEDWGPNNRILKNYLSFSFSRAVFLTERDGVLGKAHTARQVLKRDQHGVAFLKEALQKPALARVGPGVGLKQAVDGLVAARVQAGVEQAAVAVEHQRQVGRRGLDPSELVFDYRLPIRSNIDHILGDEENLTRIPASLMGEGNSLLLRRAFEGAVVEAARRAAANYTLAVPQFYGGRIQLLLPLCLTGDKPELALTIQREDGFYAARTCLTLEMAYNNARLICRPETSWIKR